MTVKRDLIIAVLTTFCMTATLFMILPTQSLPGNGYDPWLDTNDDGTINILDISLLAMAFGSTPEDPNWNQIVDLNNDEIINILDISTVAMEFGKTV